MSRVMHKLITALVEIYYSGRLNRPLITFQQAGRKWSRAAVLVTALGGLVGLGTLICAFCLGPFIQFFDQTFSQKVLQYKPNNWETPRRQIWTAPHLLDSMIYYLTSGVFCYAKRSTKQTIYARVQENGCRNHGKRTSEYLCSDAGIRN